MQRCVGIGASPYYEFWLLHNVRPTLSYVILCSGYHPKLSHLHVQLNLYELVWGTCYTIDYPYTCMLSYWRGTACFLLYPLSVQPISLKWIGLRDIIYAYIKRQNSSMSTFRV